MQIINIREIAFSNRLALLLILSDKILILQDSKEINIK